MTNSISPMLYLNESMTNLSPIDYSWINASWMRSVYNVYTVRTKTLSFFPGVCGNSYLTNFTCWFTTLWLMNGIYWSPWMASSSHHEWHLLVIMNGMYWSSWLASTGHHEWHLLVIMNDSPDGGGHYSV